jgi:hypothetical protein
MASRVEERVVQSNSLMAISKSSLRDLVLASVIPALAR